MYILIAGSRSWAPAGLVGAVHLIRALSSRRERVTKELLYELFRLGSSGSAHDSSSSTLT